MRISAVVVGQNKPDMRERGVWCLSSLLDTFDEVLFVDWASETPLLSVIGERLPEGRRERLVSLEVTPEEARELVAPPGGYPDPTALDICEVLARNIGIRRATGEWIVSTNIDIVVPARGWFDRFNWQPDTFYTVGRQDVPESAIDGVADLEALRMRLHGAETWRHGKSAACAGDVWSQIDCCGDFQLAHRDVWYAIRGFEESMTGRMFTDTNVQKKAALAGYQLEARFEDPVFPVWHVNHAGREAPGGGRTNDLGRDVLAFTGTRNPDDWGLPGRDFGGKPLLMRLYNRACTQESDFKGHVETLCDLVVSGGGSAVVELGTRRGVSLAGILMGAYRRKGRVPGTGAVVHSVDWDRQPEVDRLEAAAQEAKVKYHYHQADTTKTPPEGVPGQIDFLFIDTLHTRQQVAAELAQYAGRVREGGVIAFHDVRLFGWQDEFHPEGEEGGILTAIFDWMRLTRWRFQVVSFSPRYCGFLAVRVVGRD